MPDTSSAIARLRPMRRRRIPRRQSRRLVSRAESHLIVVSGVAAGQSTRSERVRSGAWTMYSRWEWTIAKVRAERARRGAHPSWW